MTSPFARRREPENGGDVNPLPPLRGYFPQKGKISLGLIFPLWGKWPEGPRGALFSISIPPPAFPAQAGIQNRANRPLELRSLGPRLRGGWGCG